jgi:Domain of unknown function (DUF4260)
MELTYTHSGRAARRIAYGLLAVALLGAIVYEVTAHGTGYWQLAVFGLGPDVALLAGGGRGLARGRLHPRGVPVYNALHRFWGPLALLVAVPALGLPSGYLVGGLAWAFHVALDRALGYGLRTRDGFQRP